MTQVAIDGLAVLKIIKHCSEALPAMVAGSLLGLDQGETLEVTHSFPFPTGKDQGSRPQQQPQGEEGDKGADTSDGQDYQMEMMKVSGPGRDDAPSIRSSFPRDART